MTWGVASMTAPLRRVALRAPGPGMLGADPAAWHYGASFDPARVMDEHAALVALLRADGIELLWMAGDDGGNADAVFTYDASLMTPDGAVLMAPGKPLRAGEQELHRAFYAEHGITLLGEIAAPGLGEAGDMFWLDPATLAVGRGFRTNQAGIEQLRAILASRGIGVETFDLPYHAGPDACLHLLSLLSPIDDKVVLAHLPLLPVALHDAFSARGIELLAAPEDEFEASGGLSVNVLATAPGHCIMLDGFPETRALLEGAGIEVRVFDGRALCLACEGGPTCLTRPIRRDPS